MARDPLWHHQDWTRLTSRVASVRHNRRGPQSLVDLSIAVLANNMACIEGEHLAGMPEELLVRLWEVLGEW